MRINVKTIKYWAVKMVYSGCVACVVLSGAGCASTHKTTTTETTVAYPASVEAGDQHHRVAVEKTETATATTETKSGHPGILSSALHAIGWVVALPFRLVGGLIGWIF